MIREKNPLLAVCGAVYLLLYTSCANRISQELVSIHFTPPGTIEVTDTLFIDQYEVSNISYREFLFVLETLCGPNSEVKFSMVPKTSVWQDVKEIDCGASVSELNPSTTQLLSKSYLHSPLYDNYPVVGVSHYQAKKYAIWRTNAVNAYLLSKSGEIPKKAGIRFSLLDYLDQQCLRDQVDYNKRYPIYMLPDEEILQKINWMTSDQQWSKDELCWQLSNEDSKPFMLTSNGPYDMAGEVSQLEGNLAEMTNVAGVAYGGSWIDDSVECSLSKKKLYDAPKAWVGFRCAAKMMTFEQIMDYYRPDTEWHSGKMITRN